MKISHKPTRHGKILSIVFDNENEYEKFIAVIKADIDFIHKKYENGEELTEYIKDIYEKLQKRYTINPEYNDGKPSTFLFDNDWTRIHFDYFFNMIYYLEELAEKNENQKSLIDELLKNNQLKEDLISLKEQIISKLEEKIKNRNEALEYLTKFLEEFPQISKEQKVVIKKIKRKIKY